MCQVVSVTDFFLFVILPVMSLFLFIPQSLREYQKWKSSRTPKHLSSSIILASLSLFFFSTFYLICMNYLMRQAEMLTANKPLRLVVLTGLLLLVYYVLIPQVIKQYDNWRDRRKSQDFSAMIFFGFVTFFALTFFYLLTIQNTGILPHV
ncbi:MAG TPA: hypothetical protein VLF94_06955 [Chlamydiales bacterium]|nr:hypothetical protein [Chlamydiales bacterium]